MLWGDKGGMAGERARG